MDWFGGGSDEWRGFKRITEQEYLEWEQQNQLNEIRKDVYIVVPDRPEYNLKLRYGSSLELKTRKRRSEEGVETWIKTIAGKCSSTNVTEIVSILSKHKKGELKTVGEILSKYQQTDVVVAQVHKLRRHVGHEWVRMRIAIDGDADSVYFESFNIEGAKVDPKKIKEAVRKKMESCEYVGGYSGFLLWLKQ